VQDLHPAAYAVGGDEVGLVERAAVVAVTAVAGAGVRDLERDDERPAREPVDRALAYDEAGFYEGRPFHIYFTL